MKQVQDPIYGYIDIESEYVPLIDSAEFQRLRNIRQTGYESLYPSALHNRFVHSLGVFYLGKKAFNNFKKNVEGKYQIDNWEEIEKTFALACLLHDVGHSPFSHTGEKFYERSTDFIGQISSLVDSKELVHDMADQGWGKAHEAMSVIVGLQLLNNVGLPFEIDKELFARSIMGVLYKETHKNSVLFNAIIGMLNGNIIDVDKIDYLRRDAYVTGYSSMAIDYDRILSGYTVSIYNNQGKKQEVAAFKKKSLSVIENIAQANDLERRWVQSNPVILYDCRLVEMAIIKFNGYMMRNRKLVKKYKNIFNLTALSKEGFPPKEKISLRLLSDDDIICYLKNTDDPDLEVIRRQYFTRTQRYKPLWKNEAEFSELVAKQISKSKLSDFFENIRDAVSFPENIFFLNQEEFDIRINRLKEKSADESDSALQKAYNILALFHRFSEEKGLDFQFAIIKGTAFESNYQKFEGNGAYVELDDGKAIRLKDTLAVRASSTSEERELLFHVYTTVDNINKVSDRQQLRSLLTDYINQNWTISR